MLNHAHDALGGTGKIMQRSRLAADVHGFGGFLQFSRRDLGKPKLAAPAVDIGVIAAGHAAEGDHADVGLTAIAVHFKGGHAHGGRRRFGPAIRSFPSERRGISGRRLNHRSRVWITGEPVNREVSRRSGDGEEKYRETGGNEGG